MTDLQVTSVTDTSMMLTWTQVAVSTGEPARYRVKTGSSSGLSEDWGEQTVVCDRTIRGTQPGVPISCIAEGFGPGTTHAFRLGSFGLEDGVWVDFEYSNIASGTTHSHVVTDLNVIDYTESTLTFRWTQVDDGTGEPARYRLRYGPPPLEGWRDGTIGCDRSIEGTAIGEFMTCTIEGLEENTPYDVQLGSYRLVDGAWTNFQLSNLAGGRTGIAPGGVDDLRATSETSTSLTMTWTQIDDGTGSPAHYRVRYTRDGVNDDVWGDWTLGCNVRGTVIGEPISCTIDGLYAGTWYVQLMSYRLVDGVWADAQYSNRAWEYVPPQ